MQDNDTAMSILDSIAEALSQRGFEPYEQIYGYFKTGDVSYITRKVRLVKRSLPSAVRRFAAILKKRCQG